MMSLPNSWTNTNFLSRNTTNWTLHFVLNFQPLTPRTNLELICEYDALPGIGHACGHNLIAEIGVAAGIAIKHAMTSCGETLTGQVSQKIYFSHLFSSCFETVSCDKDF